MENTHFEDWYVISTVDGTNGDGIPLGQILCRNKDWIPEVVKTRNIKNPIITKYNDFMQQGGVA